MLAAFDAFGEAGLSAEDILQFKTERYETLARLYLFRCSDAYRETLDCELESRSLYDALDAYILNDDECRYLKFFLVVFLNESAERPDWLQTFDADLSYYAFKVPSLTKRVFQLKARQG